MAENQSRGLWSQVLCKSWLTSLHFPKLAENWERVALIWTPAPLAEEKGALLLKRKSAGPDKNLRGGYAALRERITLAVSLVSLMGA